MPSMPLRLNRFRLGLLALAPALLLTLVTALSCIFFFLQQAERQARDYGEASLLTLAEVAAEYVEHENTIALTVLAENLQRKTQASIEIYDAKRDLLAYASPKNGSHESRGSTFERQLIYQDAVIGHVRLRMKAQAGFPALALLPSIAALLLLACLLWLKQQQVAAWLASAPFKHRKARADDSSTKHDQAEGVAEAEADYHSQVPVTANAESSSDFPAHHQAMPAPEPTSKVTRLVMKIRPGFCLDRYLSMFEYALEMYQGEVETIHQEELVVLFDSAFEAGCAGLLVKSLAEQLPGNMTFGGALQPEDPEVDDATTQRKRLAYLASISEGELLVHEGTLDAADGFELGSFQHSLIDDGMTKVLALRGTDLIEQHANRILAEIG